MSVNGSINKRLETSLGLLSTGPATLGRRLKEAGQTTRASVDIGFSRQLSQARFQEDRDQRQRQDQLEDTEAARQQQLEDEDRALRLKTQLFATGIAVESGQQTGDWSALKNMVDSGGIDPVIQPQMELIVNAAVPQGLDWALKQGDMLIKGRNATSAELANAIKQKGLDERTRNNLRKMFLQKQKLNFERAEADLERAIANDDVGVIKNFFDTSPMLTEEERAEWQSAVTGKVSGPQAINVMNRFLAEKRALAVQEARNAAREGKSPEDFDLFRNIRDDYQGITKPLREELKTIGDIENLLNQEQTAPVNAALTNKVSALFSSNLRAQAELNRWKNVGTFGQRVVNSFTEYFAGTRSESSLEDIRKTVQNYKVDVVAAHNKEKAKAYDNLIEYSGGREDPSQLFPDADTRFVEKADQYGNIWRYDSWLDAYTKIKSAGGSSQ